MYSLGLHGVCSPLLDRQLPEGYQLSPYLMGKSLRGQTIVPADYRTTASNAGDGVYVYWGQGGWSWGIPYVAGLCALAWQIDQSLKYVEIEELLRRTATAKPDGSRVLGPTAFIEAVTARSR